METKLNKRRWNHATTRRVIAALLGAGLADASAQVSLDGSLGTSGPLTGPNYTIPDSVGRTVGHNLFHSFGQFNLATGEAATFTGPVAIQNILSRVTGGSVSTIDGRIDSTAMPQANFYFINPAGVLFGPHAQIDVGGSFAVSTADYLVLADGGRFDAANPADDLLTTASPAAFGFLNPAPASVSFDGTTLSVVDGNVLSVVAGDVALDHTLLLARSGRVNVVSVAASGEVALQPDDTSAPLRVAMFDRLGQVSMVNDSFITVNGDPGGEIILRAHDLVINRGGIEADTLGDTPGAGIMIELDNSLAISSGIIRALTAGGGDGADISIIAPLITLADSVSIGTDSLYPATGNAGNISIDTDTLTMKQTIISVSTGTAGHAGNLVIIARSSIDMESGAFITAATFNGPSGSIHLVTPSLQMGPETVISTAAHGDFEGGNILLEADRLTMGPDAVISASTDGYAAGGTVEIVASSIHMDASGQSLFSGVFARTESFDDAAGGNIIIYPAASGGLDIDMSHGAQISTESLYSGAAGAITIEATSLRLEDGSSIVSSSAGSGVAGSLVLAIDGTVRLEGGSALSVSSTETDGGNIIITATGDITLLDSQITGRAGGNGGNVVLTSPTQVYLRGSHITAQAITGDGGNIAIDPVFIIFDGSEINTSAGNNGGNINLISQFVLASPSLDETLFFTGLSGVDGLVTIVSPDVDLSGNVAELNIDLLTIDAQLGPHCAVRLPGNVSSFVLTGRGGAPVSPNSLLPALPVVSGESAE